MLDPAGAGLPATHDHQATTSERGAFCTARCSCGWYGPARRARSLAREDAAAHLGHAAADGTAKPRSPSA
ncbi:hypothetical protein ACZ90_49450 [Streptomyces albus subsp. albus]|nr:hypothetical protein ACZ90_49450 [Streptomyces albus subsp. albus]